MYIQVGINLCRSLFIVFTLFGAVSLYGIISCPWDIRYTKAGLFNVVGLLIVRLLLYVFNMLAVW